MLLTWTIREPTWDRPTLAPAEIYSTPQQTLTDCILSSMIDNPTMLACRSFSTDLYEYTVLER